MLRMKKSCAIMHNSFGFKAEFYIADSNSNPIVRKMYVF